MTIFTQLHMERPLQIPHSSGQHHRPPRKFGAGFSNLEIKIPGELLDLFEIGRVGAVRSLEGGARQVLETGALESPLQFRVFGLRPGAKSYRDLKPLVGMRIMDEARAINRPAFAA
jgi:hypothetical protein